MPFIISKAENRFSLLLTEFDSQASLFCTYGSERAALEELGKLLKCALENADPKLME